MNSGTEVDKSQRVAAAYCIFAFDILLNVIL